MLPFQEIQVDDILVVSYEIPQATMENAKKLKDYLTRKINSGTLKLILDCSKIDYMDSTFLGALVFTLKKVIPLGGDLRLIMGDMKSPIWFMFESTRMFKVFKTYPSFEDALGSYESQNDK